MANYLYNGIELPDINTVWTDKETYPYAVIGTFDYGLIIPDYAGCLFSSLILLSEPCIEQGDDLVANKPCLIKTYGLAAGKLATDFGHPENSWYFDSESENVEGFLVAFSADVSIWSSFDILKEDGTVFLAASEPVPVGGADEKIFIKKSTLNSIAQSTMRKRGLTSIAVENISSEIDGITAEPTDEEKEAIINEALSNIPNAEDLSL